MKFRFWKIAVDVSMRSIVQYEVTNVYEYSVSIYVSPILLYNAIFAMHDNPAQLQSMSNTRDS